MTLITFVNIAICLWGIGLCTWCAVTDKIYTQSASAIAFLGFTCLGWAWQASLVIDSENHLRWDYTVSRLLLIIGFSFLIRGRLRCEGGVCQIGVQKTNRIKVH